jgi:hypothetical protein
VSICVVCVTSPESPGLATRTEIAMLQPVHSVTDVIDTCGGSTSGQFQFQLRTIVVVPGGGSGRSAGVGSSLQFQDQFQTMVFGESGVVLSVIPLELSLVVLPVAACVGCSVGVAPADGVCSGVGAVSGVGSFVGTDVDSGGTTGDIGG